MHCFAAIDGWSGTVLSLTVAPLLALTMTGLAAAQYDGKRVMTGVRFDGETSVISVVVKGGPAERAGIKVGDELISVGTDLVIQPIDMLRVLKGKKPGDRVTLEIRRGTEFLKFDLNLIRAVKGDVEVDQDGTVIQNVARFGIEGELGPVLTCSQWWDVPKGQSAKLAKNRGKVVCMLMFQTDCPHSKKRGLPEYKMIQQHFENDPDIRTIAIQTPFRNYDINSFEAGSLLFQSLGIKGPLGYDSQRGKKSRTYQNYKAFGTPWIVVLSPDGVVHYNDSSLPLDEAIVMFGSLKKQHAESKSTGEDN